MSTTTIIATLNIGDAGIPFDTKIDVDYEQIGNDIVVTYWMEDKSPYDNPPPLWYKMIEEKIDEYFYELCSDYKVTFQNLI